MKRRIVQYIVMFCMIIVAFVFYNDRDVYAKDYNVPDTWKNIDTVSEKTCVNGIALAVDGELKENYLDIYYSDGSSNDFRHVGVIQNDNGLKSSLDTTDDDDIYIAHLPSTNDKMYQVHSGKIKKDFANFSMVAHMLVHGREVQKSTEYSFKSYDKDSLYEFSLFKNDELFLGREGIYGGSYIYNLYRARELSATTEVSVNENGGKLLNGGEAYYTEDGYYIRKLPTASKIRPGYKVEFLGWYDSSEGGNKLKENTWYKSGTAMYARWNETILSYPVSYIDIVGDEKTGKVLDKFTKNIKYGEKISGSELGCDSTLGKYYKGYAYKGCSSITVSEENKVVYRYFTPHKYSIIFDANNATKGQMGKIENCKYDEEIKLPRNLFERKYCVNLNLSSENATCDTSMISIPCSFLGWSTSRNGKIIYSDEELVSNLTDNDCEVTLYPVWSEEFENIVTTPKRLGYDFAGWTTEPEGQRGTRQFSISEDCTLFAVWKPSYVKYHVQYYKENNSGEYELVSSYEFDGYTDDIVSISLSDNSFQGYELDEQASVLSGKIKGDGSLILTAFYERKKNVIKYDGNGGVLQNDLGVKKLKYGEKITVTDDIPYRDCYTFGGWIADLNKPNNVIAGGSEFTVPNHDVTFYAKWIPIKYSICFNAQNTANDKKIISLSYDEKINLPENKFFNPGYEFSSWNTKADGSGAEYKDNEEIQGLTDKDKEVVNLYAIWKPVKFDVKYVVNSPVDNMLFEGIVNDTSYCFNEHSYTSKDLFNIKGYDFIEWNTKSDGSGKGFRPGEDITGKLLNDEQTLYAIWSKKKNIRITLELYKSEEKVDEVVIKGSDGEKLEDALKRTYEDDKEDIVYFYPGYKVINTEIFDEIVNVDNENIFKLIIEERKCSIAYKFRNKSKDINICEISLYGDKIMLPEKIEDEEENVFFPKAYLSQKGEMYFPKDEIELKNDLVLFPQYEILLSSEGRVVKKAYFTIGSSFQLPELERKGYDLLGWRLGDSQKTLSIKSNVDLKDGEIIYAAWSSPKKYKINYEIDDSRIEILERAVKEYQFGSETVLPTDSEVAVDLEYKFIGWYKKGDSSRTIIRKISSDETGDVILVPLLVKNQLTDNGSISKNNQVNVVTKKSEKIETGTASKVVKLKKGKKIKKSGITYKISYISKNRNEVSVCGYYGKKSSYNIPKQITYNKIKFKVSSISKKAFYKNKKLKQVRINNNIKSISSYAFSKCNSLNKIIIKSNIKISKNAFTKSKKKVKLCVPKKYLKKYNKMNIKNVSIKAY